MTDSTPPDITISDKSDLIWPMIIGLLTALAFTASYISLGNSQSYSVANIFLIPIILASFIYQRKGIIYTVAVTALFVILAVLMNHHETLFDTGIYAVIMIGIGLIITLLSIALHKSENRYKILFETSPAPMIVIDSRNIIRDINDSQFKIFGYDSRSLIGKNFFELEFIPQECRMNMCESIIGGEGTEITSGQNSGRHPRQKGQGQKTKTKKNPEMPQNRTLIIHINDINGVTHTCQVFHSTLRNEYGTVELRIIGMLDITENVIAQKNLRISLKEKEMLIREVHHRVKNNLQVIVSLLKLQMNRTEDEQARETLRDCQTRIYSMAMVHEKLYRSEGLAEIDVREYLENLARNIMIEYSEKLGDISIEVTGDSDLSFDLDTIVPCALITNELITNSYKYAFPDKRAGRISIDISMQKPAPAQEGDAENEVHYIYTYRDNGVGIRNPAAAGGAEGSGEGTGTGADGAGGSQKQKNAGNLLNNPDTLGMKIIRSLVRQLNGVIEIKNSGESSEGTEIIINFRGKL